MRPAGRLLAFMLSIISYRQSVGASCPQRRDSRSINPQSSMCLKNPTLGAYVVTNNRGWLCNPCSTPFSFPFDSPPFLYTYICISLSLSPYSPVSWEIRTPPFSSTDCSTPSPLLPRFCLRFYVYGWAVLKSNSAATCSFFPWAM